MDRSLVDTSAISGWGVDAAGSNDPTYPIRHREDLQTRGLTWSRPALQDADVEILRSIEHNRQPAVVGTSTPPRGISGMIRRYAFRRSESDWWHWLLLMGADRIDVVEGVIEDLGQGTVPNIPGEMGVRAEWQHNKKGLAVKVAVASGVAVALALALRGRRNHSGEPAPETATIALGIGETPLSDALDRGFVSDDRHPSPEGESNQRSGAANAES
ncbi:MAG TPA: hypothetical protein VNJ10_10785 [Sphingomonas sp.]|nr:hypothetical protein [Sphingomonas sp.]